MSEKKPNFKLPSPTDFLLKTPFYQKFTVLNFGDLYKVKYFGGPIDCFCTGCNKEATFKNDDIEKQRRLAASVEPVITRGRVQVSEPETGTFELPFKCTRCGHTYYFVFFVDTNYINPENKEEIPYKLYTIQKIGQFPSYSDLNSYSISKYRKVLDQNKFKEFSRSIHLASHDIGIASFTYLRRIFESLIEDARQEATTQETWNNEEFIKYQMDKKITALKAFLPPFLTEHPKIYSILSKGIHELTEEECLAHFEVIKAGIELILDQKLEKAERDLKLKEANAALQRVYQGVS
jgi:hypothetical protein